MVQDFVVARRLHPPKQCKLQSAYYARAWETNLKPRFNAWWTTYKHKFSDDVNNHIMNEHNLFVERALKAEPQDYQDDLHAVRHPKSKDLRHSQIETRKDEDSLY